MPRRYCVCHTCPTSATQTEVNVVQRVVEGLQQRVDEAERDKRQSNELHLANTSKVRRLPPTEVNDDMGDPSVTVQPKPYPGG